MKPCIHLTFSIAWVTAISALAQDTDITNQMQTAGYSITDSGQHHRVWSRLSYVTNSGVVSLATNTITQLSTGLHRSVSNQWVVSNPQIVLTSTGIVARGASHTALFATNANTYGAITMKLPDGQILRSHLLGLAYQDPSTGSNLMFAVLKDSTAQIIG